MQHLNDDPHKNYNLLYIQQINLRIIHKTYKPQVHDLHKKKLFLFHLQQ